MYCMINYYKYDYYFDFLLYGKYFLNMVFGLKICWNNEWIILYVYIMYNVFDMYYNSSYSSILYWNYGILGIIIEVFICSIKY